MNNDKGLSVQQFVERAVEGGWGKDFIKNIPEKGFPICVDNLSGTTWVSFLGMQWSLSDILIDPLAWQAVGKVEGWTEKANVSVRETESGRWETVPHEHRMHRFIDALCDGKTLPEALAQATS